MPRRIFTYLLLLVLIAFFLLVSIVEGMGSHSFRTGVGGGIISFIGVLFLLMQEAIRLSNKNKKG
jgi:hypothetical protein